MRAVSLVIGGLLVCLQAQAAGKTGKCPADYKGLEVRATITSAVLPRDKPVPVVVTLHNGGDDPVPLRSYMELTWYWLDFEVTGPTGKQLPYIGPEYKIIDDGTMVVLAPGYLWGRRLDDLRGAYDLSAPGRYRIRAIYGLAPDGTCRRGTIVSNFVSFDVK